MSKGTLFCGGSVLAVTLAMTLAVAPSVAAAQPPTEIQDTESAETPQDGSTEVEEIISTGTFIRGTAEDTALPVEVYGRQELLNRGSPRIEELVRGLSEVGMIATGSLSRSSPGEQIGASSINLRNLGAGRTLVTLNGRRISEDPQSNSGAINATGGAAQNINQVPTEVLQQIEILKDTGAASYGSDAVAGVVNFITRRDLNGLEVNAAYTYTAGSQGGDYDASILWGRRNDSGNVLLSLYYSHMSPIPTSSAFALSRSPYYGWDNTQRTQDIGAYVFQVPTSIGGANTTLNSIRMGAGAAVLQEYAGSANPNAYPAIGTTSFGIGVMRDESCLEVGGRRGFSDTPSPSCFSRIDQYEDNQNIQDIYRVFGDVNFDLTDKIRYHGEFMFSKQALYLRSQNNGNGPATPCDPWPDAAPPQLTATATTTVPAGVPTQTPRACTGYTVNGLGSYSLPGYNPAVFNYVTHAFNETGQRVFTDDQIRALTGQHPTTRAFEPTALANSAGGGQVGQAYVPVAGFGRIGLPNAIWRVFAAGAPGFPDGEVPYTNDSIVFRTTQQLKGDLGEVFGTVIDYDLSATYSRDVVVLEGQNIMMDRLQRALNGFANNLDDLGADGLGCTATETSGSRVLDPDGAGPLGTVTVASVPYTVGAGGGTDYDPSVAGVQAAGNGFTPTSVSVRGNRCFFLNPFPSANERSILNGKRNDQTPTSTTVGFVGGSPTGTASDYQGYADGYGLSNAPGIVRWIYRNREIRQESDTINLDAVFNGQVPKYELWGGAISWALGGQYRYIQRTSTIDILGDRRANPCTFLQLAGEGQTSINNIINTTSTCGVTQPGAFYTSLGPTGNPYRESNTWAAFGEVNLPITDRLNMQLIVRNERTRRSGQAAFLGDTVFSGSARYQLTDAFSVHASVAEHFDSPGIDEPGFSVITAGAGNAGFFTGLPVGVQANPNSQNITFNNTELESETGTNWSVGVDFQSPDRRWNASLDFFSVTITGQPTTTNASTIARALTGSRIANAAIDVTQDVNCADPTVQILFDPNRAPALFNGRPFVQYVDNAGQTFQGCIAGTRLGGLDRSATPDGDFTDLEDWGLQISAPNRVNAAASLRQGIEAGLSYRVPDQIYGGNLSLDADVTINLVNRNTDVSVFGINVTDGIDDIGLYTGLAMAAVTRGSFGANYNRGRHNLNVRVGFTGSSASTLSTPNVQIPGRPGSNINPKDPAKCTSATFNLPTAAIPVPIQTLQSELGDPLIGDGPYVAACNLNHTIGDRLAGGAVVDLTYRVQLPRDTTLSLTVNNLFNRQPAFAFGVGYVTFNGVTPFGQQVRLGLNKKF